MRLEGASSLFLEANRSVIQCHIANRVGKWSVQIAGPIW